MRVHYGYISALRALRVYTRSITKGATECCIFLRPHPCAIFPLMHDKCKTIPANDHHECIPDTCR